MDNQLLKYTGDITYLGFTFSSDQMSDKDDYDYSIIVLLM